MLEKESTMDIELVGNKKMEGANSSIKKKRAPFSGPKTLLSNKTRFSENETSYPIEPMAVHDIKPIS